MQILVLLVPAIIATLLYEKFKDCEFSTKNYVASVLIFSFFINVTCYSVLWLQGWQYQNWALDGASILTSVPSTVKYMVIALIAAVMLSYIASFISLGKEKLIKFVFGNKKEMITAIAILILTVILGILYFG